MIDRRGMFRFFLAGAAAATAGLSLLPSGAEALTPTSGAADATKASAKGSADAMPIVPVHRCRVRRKVRVWSRGRYINTWRWVWVNC
jgi:hypothetical protein